MTTPHSVRLLFAFSALVAVMTTVSVLFIGSVCGQCPADVAVIEPCTCTVDADGMSLTLNCTEKNLNNVTVVDDILDYFLNENVTNPPLGRLLLDRTDLAVVPTKIQLFDGLISVSLTENLITSIQSSTFNFTNDKQAPKMISLTQNRLQFIAAGAFQAANYSRSVIQLDNNRLTRFESDVFQSVLEQMAPNYPSSSALTIDSNAFDCDADGLCDHLAWLVRDNPHLLDVLNGTGECNDGTKFTQLDLTDCPAETTTAEMSTTTEDETTTTTAATTDDPITSSSSSSSSTVVTTELPPPPPPTADPETIDNLQTQIIIVASVLGGVAFLLIVFTLYLLATVGSMGKNAAAINEQQQLADEPDQFLPRAMVNVSSNQQRQLAIDY